jgi:hypothetical protein
MHTTHVAKFSGMAQWPRNALAATSSNKVGAAHWDPGFRFEPPLAPWCWWVVWIAAGCESSGKIRNPGVNFFEIFSPKKSKKKHIELGHKISPFSSRKIGLHKWPEMVFVTLAPVIFNELFLPQLLRFASKQSTN